MREYWSNGNLVVILNDIDKCMQSPAFAIFLGQKVKRFKEQNRMRIQALEDNCVALINKHVLKDDKGNPEMMLADGKNKFRFKSDEDEKEYEKEYTVLMGKQFDIYI